MRAEMEQHSLKEMTVPSTWPMFGLLIWFHQCEFSLHVWWIMHVLLTFVCKYYCCSHCHEYLSYCDNTCATISTETKMWRQYHFLSLFLFFIFLNVANYYFSISRFRTKGILFSCIEQNKSIWLSFDYFAPFSMWKYEDSLTNFGMNIH